MSPGKVSKMKQVCAASPGKFASALLDILDGSIDQPSIFAPLPVEAPASPEPQAVMLKRPAAAAAVEEETPAKKKRRVNEATAQPAKIEVPVSKAKQDKAKSLAQQSMDAQRRKELKTMKLTSLKEMVVCKGLDVGSKVSMIESIITLETKSRDNIRRHKANVKTVVERKREDFAGKTNNQLKDLLQAYALSTGGTKPDRIGRLLAKWKEQGEIEKGLAGMAFQARKVELNAMDKHALYELCRKKGVDCLSKEILVERLLVHETVDIWQEVMEARRSTFGAC